MEIDETKKIFLDKADIYFKRGIWVHVILKNRKFHNGPITEITSEFFMIEDMQNGSLPIFFAEIYDIEPYKVVDEQ